MKKLSDSRRKFLKTASLTTGAFFLSSARVVSKSGISPQSSRNPAGSESGSAGYGPHQIIPY